MKIENIVICRYSNSFWDRDFRSEGILRRRDEELDSYIKCEKEPQDVQDSIPSGPKCCKAKKDLARLFFVLVIECTSST